VIVRVNGEEISMLQYRRAVRLSGVESPSPAVREELVDKLIARELAVQQALSLELQRRPEVLVELEEARRDVLARAWAAEIAASAGKLDDTAAARYYAAHPHLFAERKIYRLREAALDVGLPQLARVRERLAGGDTLADVLTWLEKEGVPVSARPVIRAAEQLPIESLPRLAATAPGESAFFETSRGVLLYEVIAVQGAPIDWNEARPAIFAHLAKQAGKQAVIAEKRHLRHRADIRFPAGSEEAALASVE
jgi:EpsD family peptidyl-prolyl cis-trans isomerase